MSWEQVPTKLAEYRTVEFGGDDEADRLLRSFGVLDGDIDMIPSYRRLAFEIELDYRLGACKNLAVSKGWRPEKLRQV